MSLRKAILSLALMAGLVPAISFAQAPAPVPALPDTERRTSFTIASQTGPFSVGFALYGDSTDYGDWLQVSLCTSAALNPCTVLTPVSQWTLSSPSGSLATLPRPITDATITLVTAQTGTLQITGARRPRRISQFAENRGVAARDINQTVTDLVAQNRERWDQFSRTIQGQPGEVISPLQPAASRAGGIMCWDATGLIPQTCAPGSAGTANVVGPNVSVVGHIATFGNTSGTLLTDGGLVGAGDVVGPASSTNGAFALYNGTTGLLLKNGPTVITLANGGTGNALTASNGGVAYSDGSSIQILAGTATAQQMLQSGSNAAPAWSTATWPATTTANQLLYSSGANTVAGLATAANGVLATNGSSVPSISSTLPSAVQANITTVGTIGAGAWNGTAVSLAFGGTGQASASAARASSGLNVDSFTGHGDSNYTILTTDRTVGTSAALTGPRVWTLPAANAVNPGQEILISDYQGTITGVNTITIARAGSDTINSAASVVLAVANGGYILKSDGISKWTALAVGAASAGGVTSITAGAGLSGGTVTTSGTFAVNYAVKSDQQAGSSAILAVNPSIQQQHPSALKAYVNWTGSGSNGAQTVNGSYNVTGVSRSATGSYTVTFTTSFANTTYSCVANNNGGVAGPNAWGETGSKATGTVFVQFVSVSGGTVVAADPTAGADLACFGTQ